MSGASDRRVRREASSVLVDAALGLARAADVTAIQRIAADAARGLVGADGATLIQREGDEVAWVDDAAIAPAFRGQRFGLSACVSGAAMRAGRPVVVADVDADIRVPLQIYRGTEIASLVVVPVGQAPAVGALCVFWGQHHEATGEDLERLQALAGAVAAATAAVAARGELRLAQARHDAELGRIADGQAREATELAARVRPALIAVDGLLDLVLLQSAALPGRSASDLAAARRTLADALAELES